jgi:hypothetical protein
MDMLAGLTNCLNYVVLEISCNSCDMAKLFNPNIDRTGRIIRAVLGLALVIAGLLLSRVQILACVTLVAAGGFVLFEALRGWCIMRACGIKTKF